MRLTQGTFSFLPDLDDDQISTQIQYCIDNGWAVSIEYTNDPHPRNTYWEMWGAPMFDLAVAIVAEKRNASISYVQRRLKIGYNRAARIIEQMELEGMIGPQIGSKGREVFMPPPIPEE